MLLLTNIHGRLGKPRKTYLLLHHHNVIYAYYIYNANNTGYREPCPMNYTFTFTKFKYVYLYVAIIDTARGIKLVVLPYLGHDSHRSFHG